MKKIVQTFSLLFLLGTTGVLVSSFQAHNGTGFRFPYQQAGLTDREAASHLLSRFSFGATPGQLEDVVKIGAEKWFQDQLTGSLPDDKVEAMLASFESLKMTNEEIVQTYPKAGQVLRMAIKDGIVDRDSARIDKKDSKDAIRNYMQEKGMKPQAELLRQLVNQKILRAAFSENQLKEVMTDFWFNHFNVAVGKGGVQQFVTSYERDVIRPNSLGKFETLLLATAKSPAMLTYLDNNKSTVNEENMMQGQKKPMKRRKNDMPDSMMNGNAKIKKPKMQGLNENYAREIMELHTLGVDGGYTQADVTEAARVLTGWSLNPEIEYSLRIRNKVNEQRLNRLGFVYDDNFLFAANKHDKGEKKVLGQSFAAGGGYEEGVKLIHLLATHSSTAKFIAKKLAVRFVSDNPSQSLVDKMAKTFLEKDGDIKEVLITMVSAAEFWSKKVLREKTKSPFELAISTVRTTGAKVQAPFQLYQWINKMGQKVYNYQAPTGFPDKGQYWINSGSLLNRMNFGLALASGRVPGVKMDLLALNANHEPESAAAALKVYSRILLPERDVEETIKRLTPMLNDPEMMDKIDQAAGKTATPSSKMDDEDDMMMDDEKPKGKGGKGPQKINIKKGGADVRLLAGNNTMLAQVVGIIIGSPEFQRR
ncbi:MAG: DUF1800 domain-containing protein [Chitinophagaceae bacterium]|nr:DUF1800 domain-containing protein [Chitinophagaceae bacterium]